MRWWGSSTAVLLLIACGARSQLGAPIIEDASTPDVIIPPPEDASPIPIDVVLPPPPIDAPEEPVLPLPLVPIVASSDSHTCAVSTAGAVKCWGDNNYGELGDGTYDSSNTPVSVVGLSSGVASVGVGKEFSCAMLQTGGMRCWGANVYHQLDDTTGGGGFQDKPVVAKDFTGLVLAAGGGETYACALDITQTTKCWGWGLGAGWEDPKDTGLDPAKVLVVVPADLPILYTVTEKGTVECWNGKGVYDADCTSPPGTLGIGPGVVDVSATEQCFVYDTGQVHCMSDSLDGGVSIVASGDAIHISGSCIVLSNGGVQCLTPVDGGSMQFTDMPGFTDAAGISFGYVARSNGHIASLDDAMDVPNFP